MADLGNKNVNTQEHASFLGAGAYNHFSPSVVRQLQMRGEFFTAYTPYQPEVSQGTLQAIFEYQTMIAELTGMDVSNASHYDGSTALAEAVMMAVNISRKKRRKVILSPAIKPQCRAVIRTYLQSMDCEIVGDDEPMTTPQDLFDLLDKNTACMVIQNPNFFGELEEVEGLAKAIHDVGALFIVHSDPHSMALFSPPGHYGADIVTAEGNGLGQPLNFGGPYLGIMACSKKLMRKMPGRLVGETVDTNGERGFVLTLSAREQHIRREKATSNICTNTGLVALGTAIYMTAMGKQGLRRVAELCYHKAHYAAQEINELDDYYVISERPFFNEFIVACSYPVSEINESLLGHKVIGGYDLEQDHPSLENLMLVSVTETNTREQIDKFVKALKKCSILVKTRRKFA